MSSNEKAESFLSLVHSVLLSFHVSLLFMIKVSILKWDYKSQLQSLVDFILSEYKNILRLHAMLFCLNIFCSFVWRLWPCFIKHYIYRCISDVLLKYIGPNLLSDKVQCFIGYLNRLLWKCISTCHLWPPPVCEILSRIVLCCSVFF